MATDIFAKIGSIKGESTDAKHKDEIEVLSFSWGVSAAAPPASGGGGGAGKATFQDLLIEHGIDRASPALFQACATGQHIRDATITHRRAGKGQQEFLIVKLSDVTVSSVNHSGTEQTPYTETVTLKFAKVDFAYRPQRPDGSLDAGLHFKFDLKANKSG
jgi:type VI secretion system secreted protein Hcp